MTVTFLVLFSLTQMQNSGFKHVFKSKIEINNSDQLSFQISTVIKTGYIRVQHV